MTSPISPASRERIIQDLGEHFAHDRLTMAEYERRVEQAYRVPSTEALMDLTRDLAPLAPVPVAPSRPPVPLGEERRPVAAGAPRRRSFLALMSGVVRRGNWLVPARIQAFACMGGIELDLTEATLTAPVTEIFALAVMAGVVVKVPAHVRLESDGFAIMGGFEDQLVEPASRDPNAPVVRVRGFALMGGVETKASGEVGDGS